MVGHLHTTHDPLIVLLSLLVAAVSSLVSLDVAERLRGGRGLAWVLWLAAASCALGGGIWSMHFIAMLAFKPPFDVRYDVGLTIASLLIAIVSTAIGYAIVAWQRAPGWPKLALAGLFAGSGVAAMHYTGMAAMIVPADISHDGLLVAVSVLIAIVAATAAFWLSLELDRTWHKLAASLVMGGAIAGMHYTAMAAVDFTADIHSDLRSLADGTPTPILAAALAIATILILAIGFIAAISDRRFDRREREEAARRLQTERRFETVVSASSSVVLLLDENGVITYDSPSTRRVLGDGTAVFCGQRLEKFIPQDNKQQYQNLMREILDAPGGTEEIEMPIVTVSGHTTYTDMAMTNLLADPHLHAIVVKLHDITEKKRFTEELRAAKERAEAGSRAKSTFLANVSHELRTPLNSIIGFSDLLLAQPNGPLQPSYFDFARDINASGKELLNLINRTLEFSRAESGNVRLESVPLDPMAEVDALVHLFQGQINAKNIALTVEPFDGRFKLLADQDKLRQVLINLLSNAVKFTGENGRINVNAEVDTTGSLVIAVQDNGCGMAEEEIAQALQPFGKGNAGLNRNFDGAGLGLAISNAWVALHDGRIIIESARSVGTLIMVKFPATRVTVAGEAELPHSRVEAAAR
ncbi:MHYT domain-containing protein [Dongia sp.]|uniref:MHYT domain-containing protein n=1 Tax=Dongia sp. TaxID=1977262 RepID=UPI0035B01941